MNAGHRIFELKEFDVRYVEPVKRLLAQLSSTPVPFDSDSLHSITESPNSRLFLLECDAVVVGMITLADYMAPTGRKLWIEDVVVDVSMRGRSFGHLLVEHVIGVAEAIGGTLMLTSKPARVAANALYRSVGFSPKETNVYKMNVGTGV